MKNFMVEITTASNGDKPVKHRFDITSKCSFDAIVSALANVGEVQRACVICKLVPVKEAA